tara:strand:- start:554 stop:919 length:366 start_codon:yes stop_codon:yes gene_type:complete
VGDIMVGKTNKTKYNKTMKVKKTKSTKVKKSKGKSEEPMVKVLNMNVNQDNPRNGFFELDWNDEFVNMLKQHGYQGESQEEIVDRWFQTLCRTIGNEQGLDSIASGYVQINRRDDGKTEVS